MIIFNNDYFLTKTKNKKTLNKNTNNISINKKVGVFDGTF